MFGLFRKPSTKERLERIEVHLRDLLSFVKRIDQQGRQIMAQNAELKAFLDSLKTYTDEIAADIDTLLARSPALNDEDRAAMQAVSDTLKNIAAKHDEPLPPPVEPPA